jgi:hypothetical protein
MTYHHTDHIHSAQLSYSPRATRVLLYVPFGHELFSVVRLGSCRRSLR